MNDEKTLENSIQPETEPVFSSAVNRLIGSYEKNLDSKLRIVMPSQFREKLGKHPLIMIPWLKRSLAIFPECNWLPLAEAISKLDLYTNFGLTVRHQVFAQAREVKMDKKEGRIVIPADMAEYARLNGKTMLLGDWDKITIWNYTYYKDQIADDGVSLTKRFPKVLQLAKGQITPEAIEAEQAKTESEAQE
ncbi:MAG: division/cell wall cluster transcriptional repressor MraZ [Candidatus Hinthialibacter sp.]